MPPDLPPSPADPTILLELDRGLYRSDRRVLTTPEGDVALSPIEGRLLEHLARHAGVPLSHRSLLADVWGYAPGVETRVLYTTIGRLRSKIERDPANPRHIRALAAAGYRFDLAPPLPAAPVDRLFGREDELAALDDALGAARLVTVLATGGMGKTRLVQAWAARSGRASVFCDLSTATDADVALRVASALGVPPAAADPASQIGPFLRARGSVVLILDNAETVLPAVGPLVRAWLEAAGEARVLATSREPLRARGERRFPLGPLPHEGAGSVAAELYLARLREGMPELALDDAELAHVGAIVSALEGMPLALELAAKRVAVLSLAELRGRQRELLRVLVTPSVTGRHASMRACLDHSWAALSPWEQAAFAQLSVFAGRFGLDAASAVLDLAAFGDAPDPVDVLQALVERSLVQVSAVGAARRFRLLDLLREYAGERLRERPGEGEAAEGRHVAWYAAFGSDDALDALRREGGRALRARLSADRDELVLACRRALGRGDGTSAGQAALAAVMVFQVEGPAAEGLRLVEAVAQAPGVPTRLQARLRLNQVLLLRSSGRLLEAKRLVAEAHALAVASGSPRLEGMALVHVALACRDDSDMAGAERALRRAVERGQEAADDLIVGVALATLVSVLRRLGRLREALEVQARALAAMEARGDAFSLIAVLGDRAVLLHMLGERAAAVEMFTRARAEAAAAGDTRNLALGRLGYGDAATEWGDLDAAIEAFDESEALFRRTGDTVTLAAASLGRAEVHRLRGDLDRAERESRAALERVRGAGGDRELPARVTLALVLAQGGQIDEARAEAEHIRGLLDGGNAEGVLAAHAVLGLVALRAGDTSSAHAARREGEALLARTDFSPDARPVRLLRELGAALDRAGEPGAAG